MASEMEQLLAMLRGGGQGYSGSSMGNQLGSGNLRPPGMQQQSPFSTGPGDQLGGGIGMPPGGGFGGNDVRTPFGGGGGGISQPPGGFGGQGSPFTGSGYSNNVSHNGPLPLGRSLQQQSPWSSGPGDQLGGQNGQGGGIPGGNNQGLLQQLMTPGSGLGNNNNDPYFGPQVGGGAVNRFPGSPQGQGGGIMQALMRMMGGGNQGMPMQRSPMADQRAYAGGSPTFNERTGYGGPGNGISPPPGGNQVYQRPNAGLNPAPMQSLAQIAQRRMPDMRIM